MYSFPFRTTALKVRQPLCDYYVVILPADLLLQVAYSDVMSARLLPSGGYELSGTQRVTKVDRLRDIADYISLPSSSFPNSIIISANFEQETGFLSGELNSPSDSVVNNRWDIVVTEGGGFELVIPSMEKLAAIIDGQHRLFAFTKVGAELAKMDLVCSVFLDLPKPFQAQLFAVINSTQKPVPKNLTYELFGYNISEEKADFWTPDKLAVFLARKLGTEESSPLIGRLNVGPLYSEDIGNLQVIGGWKVSTAVVVEGIVRLISSNPKKDSLVMLPANESRSILRNSRVDNSPLRSLYLEVRDAVLYKLVFNFFVACEQVLWQKAARDSFIVKTVGIQALFDVLRSIATDVISSKDISVDSFKSRLRFAENIDFSSYEFRNASGSGRANIRRKLLESLTYSQ
jgi:DNA phosphorothioation-associated DGQHR protein 1